MFFFLPLTFVVLSYMPEHPVETGINAGTGWEDRSYQLMSPGCNH